jgi:multiple sugar transport system permease protein
MSHVWSVRGLVAMMNFMMWFGNTTILLMAGMMGIDQSLFEAAEVDGATARQIFFQITLPNLRTILTYTLITSLIGGLSMYDIPKMLNNGNPNNATLTANMFIYNQAFQGSYMYARAAAASMIMFVIIAFFSAIVFFLMRDRKA